MTQISDKYGPPVVFRCNDGTKFLVSTCDANFVSQWKCVFYIGSTGYVETAGSFMGVRKRHKLHNMLCPHFKPEIDHIDRNKLNNCRDNLRAATTSQNGMNKGKVHFGTSRYKGVWRIKKTGKWTGEIKANGRRIKLGTHVTEKGAAMAYDTLARKLHGEFACLNFPDLDTSSLIGPHDAVREQGRKPVRRARSPTGPEQRRARGF